MEKAPFSIRFIAWFIDFIVLFVIAVVASMVLGTLSGLTAGTESILLSLISGTTSALLVLFLLFLQFLYFGYTWSKYGKSMGMHLLTIKVVRRKKGADISFLRGALRGTFGYWFSALIFSLGYLWAAFDAESEAWHDKIFDTWVVRGQL